MTNIDLTTASYPGNFAVQQDDLNTRVQVQSRKFDCSSVNLLSANTYTIFTMNASQIPVNVLISVNTAEGGAATLDVGDEDLITRFETDADINAIGVTPTLDATKEYTASKEIRIQPSADLDTAIFSVAVEYIDLETAVTT